MPAVLLYGDPGTGKTHSLLSIPENGLSLFALITEPNGLSTFLSRLREISLPSGVEVQWRRQLPHYASVGDLQKLARELSIRGIDDMLKAPPARNAQLQAGTIAQQFLAHLSDFKCECCDKSWGPVDAFDHTRVFALDSLSGLNAIAFQTVVGINPVRTLPQWGAAIGFEELVINTLLSSVPFVVVTAHTQRTTNQVTGALHIGPETLGQKYSDSIGKNFDEVIRAHRDGQRFLWSTLESGAITKFRFLQPKSDLQPSFAPIVEKWKELSDATRH